MKIIKIMHGYGTPWSEFGHGPNWSNGMLIGMDTETTDKYPENARIVTSAIYLDNPTGANDEFQWISDPECEIKLEATAIHGINNEYASKHGRKANIVIEEMVDRLMTLWLKYRAPLVMVNAPFDLTIIRQEMIRLNLGSLEDYKLPPIIDTLTIDRKLDPYRRGRRTLTATMAAYGIPIEGAHTAIGDIKGSIKLVREMAKRYPQFANCDLQQLQMLQKNAHDEWCNNYESYRRLDKTDFVISRGWPYMTYDGNIK